MKYTQLAIALFFFLSIYTVFVSPTFAQRGGASTGTPQYFPSPLPSDNACLNMMSEPDPLCQQGLCTPTPDPYMCEDNNPCTVDSCYVLPIPAYVFSAGVYIENPYYTDPNWCLFGGYCYSTAHCTHLFSCPSPGFVCPHSYVTTGLVGYTVAAGACGLTPTPSVSGTPISTPTPTISVPCVPTMCLAAEPLCGESTYGLDNCGVSCSKDGDKCASSPTPTVSPADSCLGGPAGCPSPSVGGSPSPTISGGSGTPSPVFTVTPTSSPIGGNTPPAVSGISVDQPNYCQVGLNITANVRWTFTDADGDSQQSYQVQMDADSNFGSPDLDTGEVFSPIHASGFIGSGSLKYNKRYYTRVRVRDSGGALSGWF